MRRREVVVGLMGASLASRSAHAQPAVPLLGYLSSRSRADVIAPLQEFQRGLAEAGYVDGTTVTIEYRWAEGRYEELPRLAAELVGRRPAVIATNGNVAAVAAKAATSTIPIVFAAGGNPVSLGLVASLGQPGGNVTGVTHLIAELSGKRLELLRELAPKAVRIGVLVNPNYPAGVAEGDDLKAHPLCGRTPQRSRRVGRGGSRHPSPRREDELIAGRVLPMRFPRSDLLAGCVPTAQGSRCSDPLFTEQACCVIRGCRKPREDRT
jgi:hypothetical protein